MTYYERFQTLVDEMTTNAIKGIVPKYCVIEIQNSFEEWKSKITVVKGSKEVNVKCLQM